jgi:hypothetical protein
MAIAERSAGAPARRTTTSRPGRTGEAEFEELKESLRRLLATVLDRAFGIGLDAVERLAESLEESAARGGWRLNAFFGGARASLAGQNAVWGAIKGAFAALSPAAKAALVVVLVLAIVLLPVTVVLLLLALIVIAIVAAIKTSAAA